MVWAQFPSSIMRSGEPGFWNTLPKPWDKRAAGEIVLDLDSTADSTHGQQEFSFYKGYERSIYHPLLIFERGTGYLLAAHFRREEASSSRGVRAVLQRVVRFLCQHFPDLPIRVVGDAGEILAAELALHAPQPPRFSPPLPIKTPMNTRLSRSQAPSCEKQNLHADGE
jgi:Transposase DDE domain group 1